MSPIVQTGLAWGHGLLTGAVLIATLLPFTNLRHGVVQGLAFPRLQWLSIAAVLGALAPLVQTRPVLWWTLAGAALAVAVNAAFIARFTMVWPRQTRRAAPDLMQQTDRHISVLCANVKMSNRDYGRLIALARRENPDVLIAIETDAKWVAALQVLRNDYLAHVEVPRDTGYGLILYSRLKLSEVEVEARVTDGVPSIRARVTLRSGQAIRLWAVHPEPPVIEHDTKGRDSEIAVAGLSARDDPLPVIIAGDLNDVAWSSSTRQFQRLSGLSDPRIGRGFYNTFSAHYPLFRWPLDHLFHDPHFRLVQMARGPAIGSDHFPMMFTLALGDMPEDEPTEPADPEEEGETREMIRQEARRPRDAIGSDWENDLE